MSDELRVDVSALSDRELKMLSRSYARLWHEGASSAWMQTFVHAMCVGLGEVLDGRRAVWDALVDQLDDSGAGSLVEPGSDPVADALEELGRDDGGVT